MTWARVDDAWWCHPKVLTLDLDARGLWISALSWSCQQQTDHIPDPIVRMCGDDGTAAKKLVHAGLWEENGTGWVIHDWEDYQSERAKKAAAGRKGGKKSGETRRREADERASHEADDGASDEADGGTSDEAGPSRPVPSPPDQTNTSPAGDPDVSEDARALTRKFAVGVKSNGHPIPTQGTKARDDWLLDMDLLLRRGPPGEGGVIPDPDEVSAVIDWCAADEGNGDYPGESVNVRSVKKFRKRYSELRRKAGFGGRNHAGAKSFGGVIDDE